MSMSQGEYEGYIDPEVEHGPASIYYAGGPGTVYYQPVIECLCGWSTGRCDNWTEAGQYLDSHLAGLL